MVTVLRTGWRAVPGTGLPQTGALLRGVESLLQTCVAHDESSRGSGTEAG